MPKLILGVKFIDGWEVTTQAVLAAQFAPVTNIELSSLGNIYALIIAVLGFNMTLLTLKIQFQVLFTKALQATKALFGTPDLHY